MRKLFAILILSLPCHVQAQSLTLEMAIATALKNNYEIRLSRNDSMLYAMLDQYSYGVFLPDVNAQGSILFLNNNQKQKLADGSIKERNNIHSESMTAGLALNWTLFDGMKMFISRERARAYTESSRLALQQQISQTISDVVKAYYGIVREKQQLKATMEQMALYNERVTLAEGKLRTGLGAKPELLQAKVDLNAQKAAIMREEVKIEQQKQVLSLLMAVAPESHYEVADSIPIETDLALADLIAGTEMSNPELQTAKQDIRLAKINIRDMKADRYPTLQFNSAYNFSRFRNKEVINNFTLLQNRNLGFNYGFGISIPVLNGFRVRSQIKQAEIELGYRELLLDYKKEQAVTAVRNAFRDYRMQLDVLKLEEENIGLARENAFISSERFRLGITGSLELRETQKSLQDAYDRLIAARYAAKVAETELRRLKGDLVK